ILAAVTAGEVVFQFLLATGALAALDLAAVRAEDKAATGNFPAAEAEGMNFRTILTEVDHAERELAEELETERHGGAANLVSLAFGVLGNHHRLVPVVESRFARILVVVTARTAVEAGRNHLPEADEIALERGVRPVWAFARG